MSRDLLRGRWVGVTKESSTPDLYMTLHSAINAATVEHEDSFIILGGRGNGYSDKVYKYTTWSSGFRCPLPQVREGNILPLTAIKVKSSIFKSCKHEAQTWSCDIVRIKVEVENIYYKKTLDVIFSCFGRELSPHQRGLGERSEQEAW